MIADTLCQEPFPENGDHKLLLAFSRRSECEGDVSPTVSWVVQEALHFSFADRAIHPDFIHFLGPRPNELRF